MPSEGSVAVLTGASRGLGLAIARALRGAGWRLVIDARREDALARAADELGGPPAVIALPGDVTDPVHRSAVADAAAGLGRVALVVNNASTLGPSPLPQLLELAPAAFSRLFEVNVVAPFALVQALGESLAPGATVLNITSDAALEAYTGWGGYGASKAALEHASSVLALEHPELRVLVVDPGEMRTEMYAQAFPGEDISDLPLPEEVVPVLLALVSGNAPGGRYVAHELTPEQGASS